MIPVNADMCNECEHSITSPGETWIIPKEVYQQKT